VAGTTREVVVVGEEGLGTRSLAARRWETQSLAQYFFASFLREKEGGWEPFGGKMRGTVEGGRLRVRRWVQKGEGEAVAAGTASE